MKKVFLSLVLIFSTVMSMGQSLDISNGKWTLGSVKSQNVDTLFYEVGGIVFDMGKIKKKDKYLIVCNSLGMNTTIVPIGNKFQELDFMVNYRFNRIQRKTIKKMRKELKGTVVEFYELDEYDNPYIPVGGEQNYQLTL
jgi:hypothetical protein